VARQEPYQLPRCKVRKQDEINPKMELNVDGKCMIEVDKNERG